MKRKTQEETGYLDVSGSDLSSAEKDTHEDFAVFFQHFLQQKSTHQNVVDIEILDSSRCRLGPHGVSNLLSFLSTPPSNTNASFTNLKHLYLQRNAIGSVGGRSIGRFLTLNPSIEKLDISLNDIKAGGGEPLAAKCISDALQCNSTLKSLIMDKCALGPEGAAQLADALVKNRSLTALEISGNMIGPVGGQLLFQALGSNCQLEKLGLKMNRIGGCGDKADVRSLSNALMGGVCRTMELDLSYNDLRCTGLKILAEPLTSQNCALKVLLLEKNDIMADGAMALANSLATNHSLERLVLKGNHIGDKGAKAFGDVLKSNKTLQLIDLSSCSIGNYGGAALGQGLAKNSSLQKLILDKNSLGAGPDTSFFSIGLTSNTMLKHLQLSGNGFDANSNDDVGRWGTSIAEALSQNKCLQHVNLSNNLLSESSILDSVAVHPSIQYFDFSDNNLSNVTIETQLLLAERLSTMEVNLLLNPLSSPPLGRLASHTNLEAYLQLLKNEKTAVTRIRLMVLGFGGVGKSTFCRAITNEKDAKSFQSTLVPVKEWGVDRVADWAGRLGTAWAEDAVRLIATEDVTGEKLTTLIEPTSADRGIESARPSDVLQRLCSSKYQSVHAIVFAKAIAALCAKGYLSTVGAEKVEGAIELGGKTCSLVDFAGQVEFLVSHQLLLSSMHTLCMIIQPAPSFGDARNRHYGSWSFWSKFLASLGDRRSGSLLLALSQLDKMTPDDGLLDGNNNLIQQEFSVVKEKSFGAISCRHPLRLQYAPDDIVDTIKSVKEALESSANELAKSWWVPLSYEKLADIAQLVAKRKSLEHELPILTKTELIEEIEQYCAGSAQNTQFLAKMKSDTQLLRRAIDYLEAVGDVMQAGEECILIDPIGWFSSFLAHFIKDDLAVHSVQFDSSTLKRQRGIVHLEDIVKALEHEYKAPHRHVSQVMGILCGLELCVPMDQNCNFVWKTKSISYLFPCLLPPMHSQVELAQSSIRGNAIRGHRLRESSGFIPPGLFAGILARLFQKLENGVMDPVQMWNDCAILTFNKVTRVVLRCDREEALIDVIACAEEPEQLFVGAAKGQASIVIWIVHLIKMFLRNYSKIFFKESWLCPSPQCHTGYCYKGTEFLLHSPNSLRRDTHECDVDGCWRFLGTGHQIEPPVRLNSACSSVCKNCGNKPTFRLREKSKN